MYAYDRPFSAHPSSTAHPKRRITALSVVLLALLAGGHLNAQRSPDGDTLSWTNLSASRGRSHAFVIDVAPSTSKLTLRMSGGTGDADIYVRFGEPPTLSTWDYRPYRWGNEEVVEVASPAPGRWHVMIHAYTDFQGVSLNVTALPDLVVGLEISEELVVDGSLDIVVRQPPVALEDITLLIDGEVVGAGKPLTRFVVNTLRLEDGDHRVRVSVVSHDGRRGKAEAAFEVQNPTAVVRSFEAPDVIWPGRFVEIEVETEGDVELLSADAGALFHGLSTEAEIERVDEDRFRLAFVVPDFFIDREERRTLPIEILGADGRSYVFKGIEMFLARAEPLPLISEDGLVQVSTLPLEAVREEEDTASRIVYMDPEIVVESGGDAGILRVVVQGEIEGATLFIAAEEYGGHLALPLTGHEPIAQDGDFHLFAIPIHSHAKPGEERDIAVMAGIDDPWGRRTIFDQVVLVRMLEVVPRFSVHGRVDHRYPDQSGVTTTGKLDGLEVRVRDSAGSVVTKGVVAWDGRYRITLPQNLPGAPYSLELRTEEPGGKVVTGGTLVIHSYTHPVRFTPQAFVPHELDITVPRSRSGAFHVFQMVRRANGWLRSRGLSIGQTVIVWNDGYSPGTSFYRASSDRIHLLGTSQDPDQYDDSVIVHEIGHRITRHLSRDDSPGGNHTRAARSQPSLAWSEGVATYIGQTILGHRRYVDRNSSGAFSYNIDDMTRVPKGTTDDKESGDLSEGLVAAFLWDLEDPVSSSENDQVSGLEPQFVKAFRDMRNTANLGRGLAGKTDLADFVKLLGCPLDTATKDSVHTLLSKRFDLDWLKTSGFCK